MDSAWGARDALVARGVIETQEPWPLLRPSPTPIHPPRHRAHRLEIPRLRPKPLRLRRYEQLEARVAKAVGVRLRAEAA